MSFLFRIRFMTIAVIAVSVLVFGLDVPFISPVQAAALTIKTRTKHYNFRATRFRDISRQMLRRGPQFGVHGRRVWATSRRDYQWKLEFKRQHGKCSVKRALVKMRITYTMPRLENEKRISPRFLSKWKQVYKILHRHELTHGRNYMTFARHLTSGLQKLAPRKNCFELRRAGKRLDKKLHRQSTRRNKRFDDRERGRLTRLQRGIERG